MTRTLLQRIQVLSDAQPTELLGVASSFFRALRGNEKRDPLAVMVSATEKLQEIPEHMRESVVALAEALNLPPAP
jgi:hypothetical protein